MRTEEFWKGDFGTAYMMRNKIDYTSRIPFFKEVIDLAYPGSVLEVGCNMGHNLRAIGTIDSDIELAGCDINAAAVDVASELMPEAFIEVCGADELERFDIRFDLVMTVGVLIHIPPEDLGNVMRSIIDVSDRHVLAVEYESDEVEEVEYRGHAGKLWKRPFGKMYEGMGLKLVKRWDAGPGFDRCTAVLLEKA